MPNVVSSTKSAVRLVAALAGLTCGLGCDTEPGATMVESAAAASPRSEIAAAAQSTTSPAPTSQAAPPRPAEAPAPASDRPRLVVLVVFDQFRGDFIGRWEKLFGDGGLRRLTGEGAWYQNCHYPYSGTFTGPGHASMLAGCTPSVHGIWTNDWHSRDELRKVNCVNGPESKQTPPPPPKAMAPAGYTDGATPRRFHAETFADVLKRETAGRGKVVALSMKSRSAVLPAGREPDGCY
ncbi:MAG TPA: alkaline phosphatase family protein, partial [Pirellulales bacterium]